MDFATRKSARGKFHGGDFAVFVDGSGKIAGHGGTFAAPLRHIGARPLHAHGFAHGLRKQQGVGCGVLDARTAVGAGVFDPNDADSGRAARAAIRQSPFASACGFWPPDQIVDTPSV